MIFCFPGSYKAKSCVELGKVAYTIYTNPDRRNGEVDDTGSFLENFEFLCDSHYMMAL